MITASAPSVPQGASRRVYTGRAGLAAGTPAYDLRAACVPYWLSRGISPALVARWAGRSIKVLPEIYASWIFGEEAAAMKRIEEGFELFPDDDGDIRPT